MEEKWLGKTEQWTKWKLMDQHGLTQSELAQELGSQGVVSEILRGKRAMNLRQMRALANRFSVPVTAFVGGATVVME